MRFAVLGAGALGCYFGARLQSAGHDVTFIARGQHLEAMKTNGLRLESPSGDITFDKVHAVPTLTEAGFADVVLFTVKNYDVQDAAEGLPGSLGPRSVVLTVQNGVSAPTLLAEKIGAERVLPGVVYLSADIKSPGVIRVTDEMKSLIFGAFDGNATELARTLLNALVAGGAKVALSDDIWNALWEKFIRLSSFAAITTVTRLNIGPIRETAASRELLRRLVEEAAAVARAEHPTVPADAAETSLAFLLNKVLPTVHASMLDDLMRGKRLELEWLSGEVIRRGAKLGIETPSHAFAYAALAPYKDGPPDSGH